jgi:hypothetical protein
MLVWWIRDQQKCGLALVAANFDAVAMNQVAEMKSLLTHELADKEPSIADLGKFDPNAFDTHEDVFLNLLAQSFGVLRELLHYVVCPDMPPTVYHQ